MARVKGTEVVIDRIQLIEQRGVRWTSDKRAEIKSLIGREIERDADFLAMEASL